MYSAAREGAFHQGRQGILWRTLLSQGKLALAQKQWAEAETAFTQAQALLLKLAEPVSCTRAGP